jgi:alkanesulfonate monooxygenase SsuD/methylene tetrahydromethanopterin reductase-like flavin-dependent oxidoreductase (luciferase family)
MKTEARENHNREVGVLTLGHVVCRDSRAEAEDYLAYYADEFADWGAVDYLMELQGMHAMSFTPEMLQTMRERFASGHGSLPMIGTPEDVAEQIRAVSDAGFDGMTVAFVDYTKEVTQFGREVMPILEKMGVRKPRK